MATEDRLAAGVVTEIEKLVKNHLGSGGLLVYRDVPGKLLIKEPGVEGYKEVELPRNRQLAVESIDGIVAAVKLAIDRYNGKPTVFVSVDGIVVSFDESDGSQFTQNAIYRHKWSPQWQRILGLVGGETFSIDDVRKLLRVEMRACSTTSSEKLAAALVKMSAKTSATVGSTRESNRETLGRDVESEVRSDAGEIPNSFVFEVRPSMDVLLTRKFDIDVSVDVSPRNLDHELTAEAVDVENAINETLEAAQQLIEDRLASQQIEDVQVIIGKIDTLKVDEED